MALQPHHYGVLVDEGPCYDYHGQLWGEGVAAAVLIKPELEALQESQAFKGLHGLMAALA